MRYWLQQLFTPRNANENLRRQGRLVMIISLSITVVALMLGANAIQTNQPLRIIAVTLGGALVYISCAVMAHYGIVRPAAYLVTWFTFLGVIANQLADYTPIGIAFLCIPILIASLALSSRHMLPVALISLGVALAAARGDDPVETSSFYTMFFFIGMMSALAYVGAWTVERALQGAQDARGQLQQANDSLQITNSTLESRVTERTVELQKALSEAETARTQLLEQLGLIERQSEVIREMSVPVLPISRNTLVMPLVGALDSARLTQIQEQALSRIEATRARQLLLDITGVPVVDSQVAQGLIRVVQAAALLGTNVALVGIRPEVAQSIVGLGLDLSQIKTHSDLQGALGQ